MNFATFSWPWVVGGLAALAAGLYVLQILRIRYREVTVVSTLLWRKAMQEAPVRKFWQHFRHPWAYLLILAICATIWLALAEPQPERDEDGSFHVLVLDGSAGMAAAGRYQQALAALMDQVDALPSRQRQVLWSGADTRTLLNPGEDVLLLERRLENLLPQAAPANVERLLGELSVTRRGQQNTEVLLFGAAPVRPAVLAALPEHLRVRRAYEVTPLTNNAGITALGAADAQSGAWDRVDVFLQVQSAAGAAVAAADLVIELDGAPLSVALQPAPGGENNGGNKGWLLADLPAQGGLLTVQLTREDELALDNTASLRLPSKPYIDVQLSASLDPLLRAVLGADPAVRLTAGDASLVIRRQGEDIGATLPALEFVGAGAQPQAFLLTYPEAFDTEAYFTDAVRAIGLTQIDAMALADVADRPIEVSMQAGSQWKLSLWQELLTEDFNFTRSRAFPLFIANAVRWLAGIPAAYPYAAAGRPLLADAPERSVHVVDAQGRPIDPLGVAFVPEQAGELTLDAGARPLAVSLLDPATTAGGEVSALEVAAGAAAGGVSGHHWVTVLLLLALMLIGLEWYGYRKGRMP
jgi:hypothetical protein